MPTAVNDMGTTTFIKDVGEEERVLILARYKTPNEPS
jgi:hypothetical protein